MKVNGKKIGLEAVKGAVTGASMLVPGVSGGTMALILGFYDKLIKSVSSVTKTPKKSILTILFYMVFVGLGFIAFSKVMDFLLTTIGSPMYLFFIGTILGSIPFLIKKTGIKVFKVTDILFTVGGIVLVALISMIPTDLFNYTNSSGAIKIVMLVVAGLLIAVALVLPGVSFSHILLIMGLYETVLTAIKEFDIMFLLPIGIFSLIGVACIAKVLDYSMKVYSKQTFMAIIGFVIGSSVDIFMKNVPGNSIDGLGIFFCILAFLLGGFLTFVISRFSK